MKHQNINIPLVTVVTVTYNSEKFLEETIKSIINQTYKNIEYIIIDGASTDKTVNIIKKYEKHISYWVSEADSGIYDAMNKAIDIANGEWINFMNAGDSFADKHVLENLTDKFLDLSFQVICGKWNLVDVNGKIFKTSSPVNIKQTCYATFCLHQAMFISLDYMKQHKYNLCHKYAAERELFCQMKKDNIKVYYSNNIICNFLYNKDGFSRTNKILDSIDALHAISKYVQNQEIFYSAAYKNLTSSKMTQTEKLITFSENFSIFYQNILNTISMVQNKKVILYGNGSMAKTIIALSRRDNFIILDQSNIQSITQIDFDYIVITPIYMQNQIKNKLINKYNINIQKIILLM